MISAIGFVLGIIWAIYEIIKSIISEIKRNDQKELIYTNYNSNHYLKSKTGKCPNCGHEVNKETYNSVAIKCSICGHTFWF